MMRRQHYDNCQPVFYTLLDIDAPEMIHLFKSNGLHRLPIELETLERCIEPPPNRVRFHAEFYEKQFAWCPIQLELHMATSYRECVSPFSRKRKITTSRDSRGFAENTATLYEIDVLEELVGEQLQSCMGSARIDRKDREEKERVPVDSLSKGHVSVSYPSPLAFFN